MSLPTSQKVHQVPHNSARRVPAKRKTLQGPGFKVRKDTGLATEAVDDVHEPVAMHYVLGFFQQFPVPNVLVVRLVLDAVNHCDGGKTERQRDREVNTWIIFTRQGQFISCKAAA